MGPNGDLRGLRILLVEDADEIRDALRLLLRLEGAEVVATRAAREALEQVGRRSFDVLLTDLGLPDLAGDVLIRTVVTTVRPRPRVVVVTGFGEPYLGRARAAGADVVFTKPVEWVALLGELRGRWSAAPAGAPAAAPAPVPA
ncbi:MAG TPA: response regulator [Calidithermus sp.]|jgi:two-component system CheB/CheR fusion protein|nr:response regulator [Calidithermus sp.]